ncbi:MAG: RNA polymerase factor sigma-54 [Bacteroidetes bacterium]|nr:RNA polymerase factor sigma-54 [Bacteroidota bacterium]
MLSQRQQLKLKQLISPQQIQFIKLLQIPTANLEARVKEELEVNPALEEGKQEQESESESGNEYDSYSEGPRGDHNGGESESREFNLDDYMQQDSYNYKEKLPSSSDDDDDYEAPIVQMQSFSESLNEQLDMLVLDERQRIIADHLIGSIDEDGYLRRPIPAIVNDMSFRYNFRAAPEEVLAVLEQIHQFDPPGVGARDLQECLLIQLKRKEQSQEVVWATRIVKDYFEEFSKKHFKRLQSMLGIDEDRMKDVYSQITHLNPKPGGAQTNTKHEYIIPDFLLSVENGIVDVKLNGRNAPELKVSHNYRKMYDEYKIQQKKAKTEAVKETLEFVKQKIESAQWFIEVLKQRQFTLLNTMMAIVERQRDFFISGGDERMLKPMILKDIAEKVDMDISTISRVANSKFVQTDWQIYPLKYFFTEGITTDSGEEVSNREVKRILEDLIEGESKKKPLSDDRLSEILQEKGYNIARRTVAKYREQMNIPVARLRKEV